MINSAADVVVVKNNKVLLVQQRKKSAYGLWSYPGGGIEEGETPEEAVCREVREELGAELANPKVLNTYVINTRTGHLEINSFIGSIAGDIVLKEDELMAYQWFSIEELVVMGSKLRSSVVLLQAKDALQRAT